jgi:hypothetical protein
LFHIRSVLSPAFLLLALAVPARSSLILLPTFDSSITSDPNSAIIESSINSAISLFESTYTNNFTASIYFQESPSGLGSSNFYDYSVGYSTFYSALVAQNANPAALAGLAANGGAATDNPVNGTADIEIKSANARALGIDIAPGCYTTGTAGNETCGSGSGNGGYDGIITFNTNITYPPQSNNGSNYGLISTAEHEIDEILGLGSSLENTSAASGNVTVIGGNPAPEDLFRYAAGGSRTFAVNCGASAVAAYFSYSGATDLAQFNNGCNGADFGDWASGGALQVQDAYGAPGQNPAYGSNEIAALSAIGYTVAAPTPEPGTWMLLAMSLALLWGRRSRLPDLSATARGSSPSGPDRLSLPEP